jgi:maltose/maltodextrin transport system substrate-binding protein
LKTRFCRAIGARTYPQNITDDFPISPQVGKGPDIVIWVHDKVGEWSDGGLIAPIEVSNEFESKLLPEAWQAVRHEQSVWGYPSHLNGDGNVDL